MRLSNIHPRLGLGYLSHFLSMGYTLGLWGWEADSNAYNMALDNSVP